LKKIIKLSTLIIFLLSIVNLSMADMEKQPSAELKNISLQKSEIHLEAMIKLEGEFEYQSFEISNPPRLVVEFYPVGNILTDPYLDIYSFGVDRIRTGKFQALRARVVFDLSEKLPFYRIKDVEDGIKVIFWQDEELGIEEVEKIEKVEIIKEEPKKEELAELKNISFQKINNQLEVKIDLEGKFYYQILGLTSPFRLIIDFWPVGNISTDPYLDIHNFGVDAIRTGEFQPQVGRVVFDLSEKVPSYKIKQVNGGVDVVFWHEEEFEEKVGEVEEEMVVKEEKIKEVEEVKEVEIREAIMEKKFEIEKIENSMIGFSLGSYNVRDDRFEDIYGKRGAIFGLELSRLVYNTKNHNFDVCLGVQFFSKTGASTVTKEETKFSIIPLSISGRYLFKVNNFIPFASIGLDYYNYKERSVLHDTSGSTTGYHFQGGIYYQIPKFEFMKIKLYVKYTKAKAKEDDFDVELGGTELGIKLAYGFNLL